MRHLALALLGLLALFGMEPIVGVAASAPPAATADSAHTAILGQTAQRPLREIFGFGLASSLSDPTVGYTSWNFSLLSTVAFFGLHVNDDGTFASDAGKTVWNSSALTGLVTTAHSHGTKVVLTIILQDFGAGTPHMCAGLATAHAATTVTNTVAEVKAKGVDGVNIDYEGLNGSCGTNDPSWARHSMTTFAGNLRAALPAGSYLSIDTYASSAVDTLGFFDVPGLSAKVDSFFVMAYDLEYSNYARAPLGCSKFCLGPTAPLTGYYYNDTNTAGQYVSKVPASKVILGVPYYGRKSCVAAATPNAYPTGAVTADTYLDASTEASDSQVKPGSYAGHRDSRDPSGKERWDTWFNTTMNCIRELYWDDTVSLGQKYALINRNNLRGVGIWNLNYGGGAPELWNVLATYFSLIPGLPGNVAACAGSASAMVSWTPAPSPNGPITSYQVTSNPGGITVTVPGSATFATVTGLTPGTAYTFTVQAISNSGPGVSAPSGSVTPVSGALPYTGYFSWFDSVTPGMVGDNIHLLNTGAAASTGCVALSGRMVVPFTLAAGQETHLSLPHGTIGGPVVVTVSSGPVVLASQRVQYFQSFNEVWAMEPAQAATTSYFQWFDRATPGMVGDNIHVINPGTSSANVTVSLPGATPLSFSVAAGVENYVTFPAGRIGGPVKVTSTVPVLATQRVQYYQSFNEVVAMSSAQAANTSYFQWFDRATPGMVGDNIHILNPGATPASVTVSLHGASPLTFSVGAGAEVHVTFPAGRIGGPVKVTSTQPVLASQRVQYYQSFNEVAGSAPAQAAAASHVMWFDKATPGMVGDNIHILNPGTVSATVTVSLPGSTSQTVTVAAGAEAYVTFPMGRIGGPVTISSTQPVLAAQRVQYYQSFNEVSSG